MALNRHYPSAGYRGLLKIGDTNTPTTVWPYSRSSVKERLSLITPAVNGYAGQIGIAEGSLAREGDVIIPVLSVAHLKSLMAYFAKESERTKLRYIQQDNTFNKITVQGFLTRLVIAAAANSGVEATIGIKGGVIDESSAGTPIDYAQTGQEDHVAWTPDTGITNNYLGSAQIPFHKTKLNASDGSSEFATNAYWKDVSGWSITFDNQTQEVLVTADDSADPQGMKLNQGQQIGNGNFTLINPFVSAENRNKPNLEGGIDITITDSTDASTVITIGRAIVAEYGVEQPEPNQRFTQPVNFTMAAGASSTIDTILFSYT